MCFSPCTVAIEFSILRATSVSSCAGAAPGSEAVTITVGRSMSGKFCTFIRLKDSTPPKVSSTNSITDGIGLRIDQAETFIMADRPSARGRGRRGWSRGRAGGGRAVGQPHQVAVVEEAAAAGDDAGVRRQAGQHLQPVAG